MATKQTENNKGMDKNERRHSGIIDGGGFEEHLPRTMSFEQGEKFKPTFSESEMRGRLQKLRTLMGDKELDACYLSSHAALIYFGDFVYVSIGRPYAIVVTENDFITICGTVDGGRLYRHTKYFGRNIAVTDWKADSHWVTAAKCLLQDFHQDGHPARIGFEMDHLTMERYNLLTKQLPGCEFVNVAEELMAMRLVKSVEEIDLCQKIAEIAAKVMGLILGQLREGATEVELCSYGQFELHKEIAIQFPYSEIMDSWCWVQSGINSDGAHNPSTTRALQKGDIVSVNVFPMVAGYYAPIERVVFCDHVPDAHRDIWEKNLKCHKRGLELLRAGTTCGEVAHELNKMYAQMGLLKYRTIGFGHCIGVMSQIYGRESAGELREDRPTVLKPGMMITMEPMLTIPQGEPGEGVYRDHDIVLIKEEGADVFPVFPIGPEHMVINNGD